VNVLHTFPFLDALETEMQRRLDVQDLKVNEGYLGVMWIKSLLRTRELWLPFYLQCKSTNTPCLFVHGLVFIDAFQPYLHRTVSFELIGYTLDEFPHGIRSSVHSIANHVLTVFDDSMKKNVGVDFFLEKLKQEFTEAAKGQLVHHAFLKKTVGLVRVPEKLLADLPGGCDVLGWKIETVFTEKDCSHCNHLAGDEGEEFLSPHTQATMRTDDATSRMVQIFDSMSGEAQVDFGKSIGFARKTPVFSWPGVTLNSFRLWELLHAEGLGEIPKHAENMFDAEFLRTYPSFFVDMQAQLATFNRLNPGFNFTKFASLNHFYYSFPGAMKLNFMKISVSLLRACGITPSSSLGSKFSER
jgi:hypothetical protein